MDAATAGVDSRRTTLHVGDGPRRDEVDVRYIVAGEGPPVVLLHGIGLDGAAVSWRHVLPALAEDYRTFALDFPGHGASEKPTTRYTTAYFRDALASFLSAVGVDSPRLVGISMGGAVALGHALDHDVEGLALVDSYGLGTDAPWRASASALLRTPFLHRFWWSGVTVSRGTVRGHLQTIVAGTPPERLVSDVYHAVQDAAVGRTVSSWQRSEFRPGGFETCYLDRLAGLDAPTLLVHGGADPLLPVEWSERAAARIENGELSVFENCGHWPPRERPEEFARTLRTFLTSSS